MNNNNRDDFTQKTRLTLAKRAGCAPIRNADDPLSDRTQKATVKSTSELQLTFAQRRPWGPDTTPP